jgi:hypothetical protein
VLGNYQQSIGFQESFISVLFYFWQIFATWWQIEKGLANLTKGF